MEIYSCRKFPPIQLICDEEEKQFLLKIRLEKNLLKERDRNKSDIERDLFIEILLIEKKINLNEYLLKLGDKFVKNYDN